MAEGRRDQPPGAPMMAFKKKTRYGPMFECCVCSTTNFLSEVVEVGRVAVLATEVGRERYLALPFLRSNNHLFTQLDTAWVCLTCQASMSAGRLPTLATVNGLAAPWVRLPSNLLNMSVEELDLLALNNVFSTVDGLQVGVVGQGAPDKTIFVPLAGVTSVPRHTAVTRTVSYCAYIQVFSFLQLFPTKVACVPGLIVKLKAKKSEYGIF